MSIVCFTHKPLGKRFFFFFLQKKIRLFPATVCMHMQRGIGEEPLTKAKQQNTEKTILVAHVFLLLRRMYI